MDFQLLKVTEARRETPRAVHLRLEGGDAALYEACTLPAMAIPVDLGNGETALVPLSSQPGRRHFEVVADVETPAGGRLGGLRPGAAVKVGKPEGPGFDVFGFRRCDVFLVAYGAGIGPARSTLLHILTERGAFDSVRLLYEARFLSGFAYRDDFPGWQRGHVKVYQVIQRQDMAKWRRGEEAYVHDLLRDLAPDPARSVVFASGPSDLLMGVQGAMRARRYPPERLFLHELEATTETERVAVAAPIEHAKHETVSEEALDGSGHWEDAPDHSPVFEGGKPARPSVRPEKKGAH